jgi:hypothetical protein
MQLRRLDAAEQDLAALDREIARRLEPYAVEHALLMQIPGVDRVVAAAILAEIGTDMSVFASARHLAAWAGVCPGNHESAGRQKSGRARPGNVHLTTLLVQAAVSASHTRVAHARQLLEGQVPPPQGAARRGSGRAALAIAHKILIAAYYTLQRRVAYHELGAAFLDRLSQGRTVARLKRRLEHLGYRVTLEAEPVAA